VLLREFGLMFLRLLGALQGTTKGGQWPGKLKAFIHALSLGIAWATLAQIVPLPHWIFPAFLAATLLSVFSGVFYLYGYRAILRKAFA
jgi:phosphatidylglycerophosphate synthase